jgi:hypothetical protein
MDYRHLPDAPESVKYRGGHDPSDPPFEEPDEVDQADEDSPAEAAELKQTSTQEITGIVSVLKYFNRRFGINE